jgi:hypothetical protein
VTSSYIPQPAVSVGAGVVVVDTAPLAADTPTSRHPRDGLDGTAESPSSTASSLTIDDDDDDDEDPSLRDDVAAVEPVAAVTVTVSATSPPHRDEARDSIGDIVGTKTHGDVVFGRDGGAAAGTTTTTLPTYSSPTPDGNHVVIRMQVPAAESAPSPAATTIDTPAPCIAAINTITTTATTATTAMTTAAPPPHVQPDLNFFTGRDNVIAEVVDQVKRDGNNAGRPTFRFHYPPLAPASSETSVAVHASKMQYEGADASLRDKFRPVPLHDNEHDRKRNGRRGKESNDP